MFPKFRNKNFVMKYDEDFINDLNKFKIYDDIVDIISNDNEYIDSIIISTDIKKIKEQIIRKINNHNFKSLFKNCSKEGKKKFKILFQIKWIFLNILK